MENKDHQETCPCIYCNSVCPECGSLNVRVKFTVSFDYANDIRIPINLTQDIGAIELECEECGEDFKHDGFEQDERLIPLWNALDESLDLPTGLKIEIDEKGQITTAPV